MFNGAETRCVPTEQPPRPEARQVWPGRDPGGGGGGGGGFVQKALQQRGQSHFQAAKTTLHTMIDNVIATSLWKSRISEVTKCSGSIAIAPTLKVSCRLPKTAAAELSNVWRKASP